MEFTSKPYRMADVILEKHGREHSEILTCLEDLNPEENQRTRPEMTRLFRELFSIRRWNHAISVFDEPDLAGGKIDFMKGRVGVQVSFNHYLRVGTELLRFQSLSYSDQDKIDVGVYISVSEKLVSNWKESFMLRL